MKWSELLHKGGFITPCTVWTCGRVGQMVQIKIKHWNKQNIFNKTDVICIPFLLQGPLT